MPRPDTCYLHLVRHGSTDSNLMKPPRLQGQNVNLGLSIEGRLEAERTAEWLAKRPIAAVYSSPTRRARETALPIAAKHGLELAVIDDLIEADVGRWEGLQWNQIEAEHPEAYERFMTDPGTHGYPGGENMKQVVLRAAPAIRQMMAEHLGQEIVAVAHNVVNRSYLGHLLGLLPAEARELPQHNAGVNLLRFRAGVIKVLSINAVFHLEEP